LRHLAFDDGVSILEDARLAGRLAFLLFLLMEGIFSTQATTSTVFAQWGISGLVEIPPCPPTDPCGIAAKQKMFPFRYIPYVKLQ